MPVEVQGCIYPTNAEMQMLQAELLPRFGEGRLGLSLLPFRESMMNQIVFNSPDIFRGLQNWRGLDKSPKTPEDRYNWYGTNCVVDPGYWADCDYITEHDITKLAAPGTWAEPVNLVEHTTRLQERLLERRFNRVEFNIWQSLVYGYYQALNEAGQVIHQQQYNIQMVTSGIPWSDQDNATPIQDFRCIQLLGRGTSASFGPEAVAYMNRVTANCLMRNRNPNDLGNLQITACCELALFGMDAINRKMAANGLPRFEVYDEGFVDESGNFHTYIPDGRVIIMGRRPGDVPLGNYWMTRNMLGCSVDAGFYTMINDNCQTGGVPRKITITDGHNGGPAVHYPRAVVSLETGCDFAGAGC